MATAFVSATGSHRSGQWSQVSSSTALLFVVNLLLIIGSEVLPSPIWAVGALFCFIALTVHLSRWAPAALVLLLPLIVLRLTELVSGIAIESGAYIAELGTTGTASGAFTRLLLTFVAFFLVAGPLLNRLFDHVAPSFRQSEQIWNSRLLKAQIVIVGLLLLCTLYIAYLGLAYGLPAFTGEDRFAFRWRVDSPALRLFLNNRTLMTPFMGALFITKRYRAFGIFSIIWILILSALVGEKFTSLVNIITFSAVPYGLYHVAHGRSVPISLIGKLAAMITVVTVPAILFAYGAADNPAAAAQRFGERITEQGGMWYVADRNEFSLLTWDSAPLRADLRTWMHPDRQDPTAVGAKFGLYYVMSGILQSQELRWIIETGNGFVFAQQPYLLKATGYFGLLAIMAVMACYHSILAFAIAYAIPRMHVVLLLVLGRISAFLYGYYVSGWFWNVFGITTIIAIALAAGLVWLGQYRLIAR